MTKKLEGAVNERVILAIDELIKRSVVKNNAELADEMGINRATITEIRGGRQSATTNFLEILATKYRINGGWLLTGTGSMFDKDANQTAPAAGVDLHKIEAKIEYLMKQMQDTTIQVIEYSKAVERHEEQLKRLTGS